MSPRISGRPANPAIAPEITKAKKVIFFEFTPLTRAAIGLAPEALNSKPKRVRLTMNQNAIPSAIATNNIP